MRLGSKGQGAMEYLMTYGWAILVVMIVGVVLWQLGVFGGAGGGVNRATGFTNLKPFDRSILYREGATNLTATFTNAAGTPLTVKNITATGDCAYAVNDNDLILTATADTNSFPVAGGDTFTLCCGAGCNGGAVGTLVTKVKGDSFTVNILVHYTESVAGTTIARTDSGRLTGTVE